MSLKKVTAIFDELCLSNVEQALEKHGVIGYTVYHVKGRGKYYDSYNKGRLIPHIQMDLYTHERHAEAIAQLIMSTTYVNAESEGLVCIQALDELYWIHGRRPCTDEDFGFKESL